MLFDPCLGIPIQASPVSCHLLILPPPFLPPSPPPSSPPSSPPTPPLLPPLILTFQFHFKRYIQYNSYIGHRFKARSLVHLYHSRRYLECCKKSPADQSEPSLSRTTVYICTVQPWIIPPLKNRSTLSLSLVQKQIVQLFIHLYSLNHYSICSFWESIL